MALMLQRSYLYRVITVYNSILYLLLKVRTFNPISSRVTQRGADILSRDLAILYPVLIWTWEIKEFAASYR